MSSILNADRINELSNLIERKKREKLDIITELVNLKRLEKLGSKVNYKRIEELENKNAVLDEIIVRNEQAILRLQNPKPKQNRLAFLRDTLGSGATEHLTKGLTKLKNTPTSFANFSGMTAEQAEELENLGGGKRRRKRIKSNKKRTTHRVNKRRHTRRVNNRRK